jgi:hypothetical protein
MSKTWKLAVIVIGIIIIFGVLYLLCKDVTSGETEIDKAVKVIFK